MAFKFGRQQIGIYGLLFPDGKVYIGQTKSFDRRYRDHRKKGHRNALLNEQFLRFGYDSHEMKVLHELPSDIDQKCIDEFEIFYISQYRECGVSLLNVQNGGLICAHTESSKQKLREAHLGKKKWSDEMKEHFRKLSTGRPYSDETRLKLRESKLGNKNPMYGKKVSSETLIKMSICRKGIPGKPLSLETKNKIRLVNNKSVQQFSKNNVLIKEWVSAKEAQKELKLNNISWAALGKLKSCGGFIWKYK